MEKDNPNYSFRGKSTDMQVGETSRSIPIESKLGGVRIYCGCFQKKREKNTTLTQEVKLKIARGLEGSFLIWGEKMECSLQRDESR